MIYPMLPTTRRQDNLSVFAQVAPFKLDRTRQSAPQVFEVLRELIVSVQLEPGAVVQRTELVDYFGISQTPIRDALQRLGEEHLVDIFAQHATVVSRIDLSAALQAHFLRRAIEHHCQEHIRWPSYLREL